MVADDILDPDINQNNPDMGGGTQIAGQQEPQRMVVAESMRNLPLFSHKEAKSADNYLNVFDDYLEMQQINAIDATVAQIITRFSYNLLGKAMLWYNQGRDGRPHANVADWEVLKEQLRQQFKPSKLEKYQVVW